MECSGLCRQSSGGVVILWVHISRQQKMSFIRKPKHRSRTLGPHHAISRWACDAEVHIWSIFWNGDKTKTGGHSWLKLLGQVRQRLKFICTKYGWISERIVNFINDSVGVKNKNIHFGGGGSFEISLSKFQKVKRLQIIKRSIVQTMQMGYLIGWKPC